MIYYLNKKKKFSLLFDLTKLTISDCLYSKKQLEYMLENEENTKLYISKTSILVNTKFVMNALNLLFSLKSLVRPNLITNNLEDSYTFLL